MNMRYKINLQKKPFSCIPKMNNRNLKLNTGFYIGTLKKYLGINLAKYIQDLYEENFIVL